MDFHHSEKSVKNICDRGAQNTTYIEEKFSAPLNVLVETAFFGFLVFFVWNL